MSSVRILYTADLCSVPLRLGGIYGPHTSFCHHLRSSQRSSHPQGRVYVLDTKETAVNEQANLCPCGVKDGEAGTPASGLRQ